MGQPAKPGYVPQYPQTAAVEAPYSPPRAQVLTVEPSAPQGTMVQARSGRRFAFACPLAPDVAPCPFPAMCL